jgi:IS30 family transposase
MRKPVRLKDEPDNVYYKRACNLLYDNGYSINEISAKMKLTNTEVFNYTHDNLHYLTKDECEEMIKMHNSGMTYRQIAKAMGINEGTAKRKINQYYQPNNLFDSRKNGEFLEDIKIETIKSLYRDGKTVREISDELHITVDKVRYRLRKSGLFTPEVICIKVTKAEKARFKRLHAKGVSISEIARRCGRSRITVSRYLK